MQIWPDGMLMDHPWLEGVLILVGVNVFAVFGQIVVSRHFRAKMREVDAEVLGHVAGITGVINAVLFAFIVFVAWTYYDRAKETVDQEVGLVRQLWNDAETASDTGRWLSDSLHMRVEGQLTRYLDYVCRAASPKLRGDVSTGLDVRGERCVRNAYEMVLSAKRVTSDSTTVERPSGLSGRSMRSRRWTNPAQQALITEMVGRFNMLFEAQRRRIRYGHEDAIPRTVWVALVCGGVLCIVCCWLIGFRDSYLHALIMCLIASSFGMIVILIIALSSPFRGMEAISFEAFKKLRVEIQEHEAKEGSGTSVPAFKAVIPRGAADLTGGS